MYFVFLCFNPDLIFGIFEKTEQSTPEEDKAKHKMELILLFRLLQFVIFWKEWSNHFFKQNTPK